MGKIKSAVCLILITLVIAALCVVCFVPFPTGSGGIHYFNPLINWTDKSTDLGGNYFGGENASYSGGSFSIVLYPEGVISAKEHDDNLKMLEGEELEEFENQYVSHANGALWLDKEIVCDGGAKASESFQESFGKRLDILKTRFERLHSEGMTFELVDDYSVRVALPASLDASVASFIYYAYMGNLEISYGSDLDSATKLFPEEKKTKPITEYVSGASTSTLGGTPYVAIHFTNNGSELLANATKDAEATPGTLFFTIGGNQIIGLSVSSQLVDKDLYISGNYSQDAANIIATVIDTAIEFDCGDAELGGMETGALYWNEANFGDQALNFVYIAVGAAMLAAALFFLIRYRRLAFAHFYSFLLFLFAMVIVIWAIPTLSLGMNTLAAFAVTAVLLSVSNAVAYESARKEFALGKTMISSVKTGYKKCFWYLFDLHVAVAIIGLLLFLIGLTELSAFGLVLTLGALFSGIVTLAVNRFMWFIMMPFAKDQAKFCHFKREEVDDDE